MHILRIKLITVEAIAVVKIVAQMSSIIRIIRIVIALGSHYSTLLCQSVSYTIISSHFRIQCFLVVLWFIVALLLFIFVVTIAETWFGIAIILILILNIWMVILLVDEVFESIEICWFYRSMLSFIRIILWFVLLSALLD